MQFGEGNLQNQGLLYGPIFEKFSDDFGVIWARRSYCKQELKADSKTQGTSHLINHISSYQIRVKGNNNQIELVLGVGSDALGTWKFNQENSRKGLTAMIIQDELPFRFVEGMGFNHFTSMICPRFKVPSRWTLAK